MRMLRIIAMIMLVGSAACSFWVAAESRFVSGESGYEVELPPGWKRGFATSDGLTLTRDGIPLQLIRIARVPFDKELPHTKRKLVKGMLPQEVAEVIIDNLRSNKAIANVKPLENLPATVGGYDGFKIRYAFQTKENLKKSGIYYGVLVDQWYYYLYFEAPARHYFPRDEAAFERLKESFKITL